jgi:hypothetical protein
MPFGIDLQKIIEEDNNLEADKKIKEAIKKTLTFDEQIEENETAIRKRSKIADNFSDVDKALREVNFVEKEGMAAWRKKKKKKIQKVMKNFKTGKVKLYLVNLVLVKKIKL